MKKIHNSRGFSSIRIQKERFSSTEAYEEACKNYVVNDKTMHHAKAKMAVLHPLPRSALAELS